MPDKVTLQSVATIDSTLINAINNNNQIIQTAFDNTLSRDGTSPNQMNAAIDMNSNPVLNLPFASQANQPIVLGQLANLNSIPVGFPTLTGDVDGTVNNVTGQVPTTIQPGVVTGSKIASATITNSNIAANTITNGSLATMAANTTKANATGGTAAPTDVTPIVARSSSLLNIESITLIGDTNYQILATDRIVNNSVALTNTRTWTLPASNTVNAGHRIILVGGTSFAITVLCSGSDHFFIPGSSLSTSFTINGNFFVELINLQGNWTLISNNTFSSTVPGLVSASGGGTSNFLRADGTWAVATVTTTPTVQTFTSGTSQTYTPTAGTIYIKVRMCGGGGGGGAVNTNAGANGVTSSFGSWTAIHGNGGGTAIAAGTGGGSGGTGGVNGTGNPIVRLAGGTGFGGAFGTSAADNAGGAGGVNPFGGAGFPTPAGAGNAASANTGAGGAGGGAGNTTGGAGGGAGEYVEFFVNSPSATTYTVGGGGNGGAAGGAAGGNGAAGVIIIEEYPF